MEFDKDLSARQEARLLCHQAEQAARQLRHMTQSQLDAIVLAMAEAFAAAAEALAQQAVEETGFGNIPDKITKNLFASRRVYDKIAAMRCVGLLREDPAQRLLEIGVPVGVIAAIVPSTNPTSTVCYKALIAMKSGNAIVFSPHPKALNCTLAAARILAEAAKKAGAPAGCIGCLSLASMDGTQELMTAAEVRLILATGGPGMVKAAYSSGKPAIGVGAGNGPAYIAQDADISGALSHILRSKTFDFGTVCASEQSILVEKSMEPALLQRARELGFHLLDQAEAEKLGQLLFRPNGGLNPQVVGKSALHLAKLAGLTVPENTRILMARADKVGPQHPYSMEKLCPVLGLFVVENEEAALAKALEILSFEGQGHTFTIHTQDRSRVERFAMHMPVSRFLVNTPAALGGIGESTGLFPALTLGCGAVGGSSSSNNISPLDLVNIRRVAWGLQEPPTSPQVDPDLLEAITAKILERLK